VAYHLEGWSLVPGCILCSVRSKMERLLLLLVLVLVLM